MKTALERNQLADHLKEQDPSNPEWLLIWARAHGHFGSIQFKQCDSAVGAQEAHMSAEALAKLLEDRSSIATLRDKHYDEKEITLVRKDLENDYEIEGDALKTLGDIEAADKVYRKSLRDNEANRDRDPNEPFWRLFFAFILERLGDIAILRDDLIQASDYYKKDYDIAADLVKEDPQKSEYLSALTQSQQRIGDAWLAAGNGELAMASYKEYLSNASLLTRGDPENFRFRDFYNSAYQRIGDLYLHEGNIPLALEEFTKYRELSEQLLKDHPSNNIAMYNASNSHIKIGDALMRDKDVPGAASEYLQAEKLAIELNERELNGQHCNNGSWQKTLAVAFQRLAMALKTQGQSSKAMQNFTNCASIPVGANVWAPATVSPRDPVAFCREEIGKLKAVDPNGSAQK
jgi:tetratricopeptide (TPR) repeat protein